MKIADKWNKRLTNSPFNVDLVAEDERIYEENRIRSEEQSRLRKEVYERKEKAKNDIVLKALAEFSDLEALRSEKRAINEEEQRLKALLTLEKANANAKADRLAAERAERQRAQAKLQFRRDNYKDSLHIIMDEEAMALKKKHGLDRVDPRATGMNISTNPNNASLANTGNESMSGTGSGRKSRK